MAEAEYFRNNGSFWFEGLNIFMFLENKSVEKLLRVRRSRKWNRFNLPRKKSLKSIVKLLLNNDSRSIFCLTFGRSQSAARIDENPLIKRYTGKYSR